VNQLPTTWLGVLGILIITIPPSLIAAGAMFQSRRNRTKLGEVKDDVGVVQESVNTVNAQVTNGHTTNMRDDITQALRLMGIVKDGVEKLQDNDIRFIRGDISRLSEDVQVLRGELTHERDARIDLAKIVHKYHPDSEP
jgi:hypothetical protein